MLRVQADSGCADLAGNHGKSVCCGWLSNVVGRKLAAGFRANEFKFASPFENIGGRLGVFRFDIDDKEGLSQNLRMLQRMMSRHKLPMAYKAIGDQ